MHRSTTDLEGVTESVTVRDRDWPEPASGLRVYVREAEITASICRWSEDDRDAMGAEAWDASGREVGDLTVNIGCVVSDLGHGSAVLSRHGHDLDPDGAVHGEQIVRDGMTEEEARGALRGLLAELAAGFQEDGEA